MGDGIRIRHFESTLLQVIAEIEKRAANKERALRIDDDAHVGGMNKDVARHRAIDEVHFVLQTGAAAADDGDAQRAFGATLFLQERSEPS